MKGHEHFMRAALYEAELAYAKGEVPIGAVVVQGEEIIGRGHNLRETCRDPLAHAELLAIAQAARELEGWRLSYCRLYVTLEPCCMCAGASVNARIESIIFGTTDARAGACGSLYNLPEDVRLNHRCQIIGGILQSECTKLLQDFFAERRQRHIVMPEDLC